MDLELNNAFDQSKIDRELPRRAAVLAMDREKSGRFISAVPHQPVMNWTMSGMSDTGITTIVTASAVSHQSVMDWTMQPMSGTAITASITASAISHQSVMNWTMQPMSGTAITASAVSHQPVMNLKMPPMSGKSATPIAIMRGVLDQTSLQIVSRVVFQLIQNDQIGLARKVLNSLPVGYSNQAMIDKIRKILAPPTTKASSRRDADRQRDYLWIKDHAEEYRGQWVALDEGQLVANASSLQELLNRVKQLGLGNRPLLHCITS